MTIIFDVFPYASEPLNFTALKAAAIGLSLIFSSGLAFGAEPAPLTLPVLKKAALNLARSVDVIATLENGRWDAPGGRLCWTMRAWAEETELPFRLASHEPTARRIAMQRLRRFIGICERFGVDVTPTLIGDSWRWGITQAMKNAKRLKPSDYAVRFGNLYGDPTFVLQNPRA